MFYLFFQTSFLQSFFVQQISFSHFGFVKLTVQFILYNCEVLDSVQLALINDHKKVQTVMYLFI